jgi:hypothetical protein
MKRTTAPGSAAGFHVDRVPGVSSGSKGTAEDRNNLQEEVSAVVEGVGVALDGTDWMQLEKAIIANSHFPGETLDSAVELTPVGWASARSEIHPAYPKYCPVLYIGDADHDIAASAYPLLVAALRAQKAKAWSTGTTYITDHSVTVAAHVVTGSGVAWDGLLAALADDLLVDSAADTLAGGWGYGKSAYSNWRALNVGGTDYAITNVNVGAHTITITGDALAGAQTAIFYPNRIAGDTTKARTFRDSGRASVSADGREAVGGTRRRDRMQGHYHGISDGTGLVAKKDPGGSTDDNIAAAKWIQTASITGPSTDGTNGTPRTGGTTEPRSAVRYRYLFAGVYLA